MTGRSPAGAVPPQLAEKAAAFAAGDRVPATPRDAATVVLVRDGSAPAAGPELYLLRRQPGMAFGGFDAFPGGRVDPRDHEGAEHWAGPSPERWATLLGVSPGFAAALLCAAVRETFEEAGVLLAGSAAGGAAGGAEGDIVGDVSGADWQADRAALERGELTMVDLLRRRDLVLRTDLLSPWSGWLTPVFEPKRYRTWFLLARLPEGQRTGEVSAESTEGVWLGAGAAAHAALDGERAMLPPTLVTCLQVAEHADVAGAQAAGAQRTVQMFMPEVEPRDDAFALTLPPGAVELIERARS